MKLLVCGGAGFIGSTFVRQRVRGTATRSSSSTSSPTPAGGRTCRTSSTRFVHGRDRGPGRRRRARSTGVDAVVNFAAETHVDRSIAEPDAFVTHARDRHVRAARGGARARAALPAGLHRRGLRLDRGGLVHRGVARCARPRPTARRRPAPTCSCSPTATPTGSRRSICRGSNNYGPCQYPEKLIPLMVLNALHGDPLPVYGDGMQVRNWLYVEDFARGIGHVLEHGAPGEAYNVGGPDECPNIEVVKRIIELHGRRRVADRVRHRPPRPRPPLLAVAPRRSARSAGSRRCASTEGLRARRSPGTATTRGGGSRSARATTASTTSASTGARSAPERPLGLRRRQLGDPPLPGGLLQLRPCAAAAGRSPAFSSTYATPVVAA